jgi:flavin-dependent dehydrogenase
VAADVYDVVIVGGRCAGAALATYLARDGASVVVLEADALGTDQVLSTHTIHPAGMDALDELGVGNSVRQGAPPARMLRLHFDDVYLDVVPPDGRDECCPRRQRLDGLLQGAASAAGAQVRERTRVTAVIQENGRVAGVKRGRLRVPSRSFPGFKDVVESCARIEPIASVLLFERSARRA